MYNTVSKNYRLSFCFGNNTGHRRYSNRVVQISINEPAFTIMLIPHYDTGKFPFPPFENNEEYKGEKFTGSDRRRILGFLEGEIIFFEYNEKAGQSFKQKYQYELATGKIQKSHRLIHCLDTETYNTITRELRKYFLYKTGNGLNGSWKRDQVIHLPAIQFIDNKLQKLKKLLPDKVKKSLELE